MTDFRRSICMSDIIDMLQALPHAITPGPAGPDLAAADVERGHRALGQRRRRRLAGAAGTVVAGAVAVVLTVTSAARPVAPARPAAQAVTADSKLMTLAARISASANSQPGNASLEIVTQTIGGKLMQVYYGLYTDTCELYSGSDKQTLMMAVTEHA